MTRIRSLVAMLLNAARSARARWIDQTDNDRIGDQWKHKYLPTKDGKVRSHLWRS